MQRYDVATLDYFIMWCETLDIAFFRLNANVGRASMLVIPYMMIWIDLGRLGRRFGVQFRHNVVEQMKDSALDSEHSKIRTIFCTCRSLEKTLSHDIIIIMNHNIIHINLSTMRILFVVVSALSLLVGNAVSYQMKNERFHLHREVRDLHHNIVRSTSASPTPTDRHPPNLSTSVLRGQLDVVKEGRHHGRERLDKDRVPRRRRDIEARITALSDASSSIMHQFESKKQKSGRIEASKRNAFTYYHMNGLHLR
jgi:hypothetical protein